MEGRFEHEGLAVEESDFDTPILSQGPLPVPATTPQKTTAQLHPQMRRALKIQGMAQQRQNRQARIGAFGPDSTLIWVMTSHRLPKIGNSRFSWPEGDPLRPNHGLILSRMRTSLRKRGCCWPQNGLNRPDTSQGLVLG